MSPFFAGSCTADDASTCDEEVTSIEYYLLSCFDGSLPDLSATICPIANDSFDCECDSSAEGDPCDELENKVYTHSDNLSTLVDVQGPTTVNNMLPSLPVNGTFIYTMTFVKSEALVELGGSPSLSVEELQRLVISEMDRHLGMNNATFGSYVVNDGEKYSFTFLVTPPTTATISDLIYANAVLSDLTYQDLSVDFVGWEVHRSGRDIAKENESAAASYHNSGAGSLITNPTFLGMVIAAGVVVGLTIGLFSTNSYLKRKQVRSQEASSEMSKYVESEPHPRYIQRSPAFV